MKARTTCGVRERPVEFVLSLGDRFVSESDSSSPEQGVELAICDGCKLLQLGHSVAAETIYRRHWSRSDTHKTLRDAVADIPHMPSALIHLRQAGDVV